MQSLHECITRKGCRDVCSAQQHVNKYATHVYLHKCRVTGLLQRGKGESAENWWHSKHFLGMLSVSLFVLADWKSHVAFRCRKGKVFAFKDGRIFFFFFGMLLNMSHLSKHMILWYLGAYLWAQASGGASENHRLGFPFLLWPSVRDGVCSSWASPSHSLLQGGDKSMQCIFFLLNAKSSFKKGEWEIKFR